MPGWKAYSCLERCSIPRWVYLPSYALPHPPTSPMSIVTKCMTPIPVMQDSVHRRVNFAAGFVTGRTCTGLLQERITCVGQCFP